MKRTPLRRTGGLVRGKPLTSRSAPRQTQPIPAVSRQRRARDESYPDARAKVYERSGGRCEARIDGGCTARCEVVHHIAGRGGDDPHRQSNLLGCCDPCHRWVHDNPIEATARGWMRTRLGKVD